MDFFSVVSYQIVRLFSGSIAVRADPQTGVRFRWVEPEASGSIDERISKIDSARENLRDALAAMEDMHVEAKENRRALNALKQSIAETENQHAAASTKLDNIRTLATLDTVAVRNALGVATPAQRWVERGLAFVLGVVASLLASWIWSWLH